MGIDLGGARIVSQITDGSPVIQINVGPGVDLRYVTLSNFTIEGNGLEGDGIRIVADGNDRWMYCWTLENVTVQHVGGFGLDVQGSVFEGIVSNSWMIGNAEGGASFAHSDGGGQVSALRWFGGGFEDNGGSGLLLDKGARDISVDGVTFANNAGPGISAEAGITSVSDSAFQDNGGVGVWFQNFGNFNDNTFSSSGAQAVGISGYLAGGVTLVGNSSTYTGGGADTTTLASLQGNGTAFLVDDSGKVVTGQNVAVSSTGGGNLTHVTVSTDGVDLAALEPVAAVTTAAVANSSGTSALETALKAALGAGTVVHLTDTSYTVTSSIVINITTSFQGPLGIDLGGAKILSQISDGGPVIQINVAAGVDIGTLSLSNFSIQGNGLEGDGLKIVVDGADRWIRDLDIRNVNVEHVGGIGLDVLGNVQGSIFNSWMHGNGQGGARIANSAGGGVADHLDWVGGGFRKNDVAGLILDNGAYDLTIQGAYFVDNYGPGIQATAGITQVLQSGFENNLGTGAIVGGAANFYRRLLLDVRRPDRRHRRIPDGGPGEPARGRQRVLRLGRQSHGAGQPAGHRRAGDRRHRQCRGRARHRAGRRHALRRAAAGHDRTRGLVDHRIGRRHPRGRRHPQCRRRRAAHGRAQRGGDRRRHADAGAERWRHGDLCRRLRQHQPRLQLYRGGRPEHGRSRRHGGQTSTAPPSATRPAMPPTCRRRRTTTRPACCASTPRRRPCRRSPRRAPASPMAAAPSAPARPSR